MKKYFEPVTESVEVIALSKCICFSPAGGRGKESLDDENTDSPVIPD